MVELLSRVFLLALIASIIWYIFTKIIPRAYLTWLGGLIVLLFIFVALVDPGNRVVGPYIGLLLFPLKPLGMVILLLLSSLREGIKKVAANQVVAALLILLLSSIPLVAYWLIIQAEIDPAAIQNQITPATTRAIVVLGDGNLSDPTLRGRTQVASPTTPIPESITGRLVEAGQVYRERAAQNGNLYVIVSTGRLTPNQTPEAQEAARQNITATLTAAGVPSDRIVIDSQGTSIQTSAVQVDRILQERGFVKSGGNLAQPSDSIIVVAPSVSMRRIQATFARLGIRAEPRPTNQFLFQVQNNGRPLAWIGDLIPNVDALMLTTRAIEEFLSVVYYFLRGWLLNPLLLR